MKKLLLLVLLALVGAAGWFLTRPAAPQEVPFAKARRERLVASLSTNGKVEPAEWRPIRAEKGGLIERLLIEDGRPVGAGAVVALLKAEETQNELAAAEARVAAARADLERFDRGGRPSELTEIDNAVARVEFDRRQAQQEAESLKRLVDRNAATRVELEAAERKLTSLDLEAKSLARRKSSLVTAAERTAAESRLREAESATREARRRISLAGIMSPISGVVYNLSVRSGAYLQPGDLIANVGQVKRLRVRVAVDEPELGRVAVGQPVEIGWDALPGVVWKGAVEQMPSEIVASGTRQVGQVICTIDNADGRLLPGTNVIAEIRTAVVEDAISIPKEALRTQGGQSGVFRLSGARIEWRPVRAGISSATRSQILEGLPDGDFVALPTDRVLSHQQNVRPIYP
ncbi:MAG: efflux RND transporter periplasmic adaptor subunit [Bryobacteraceae bacterium]